MKNALKYISIVVATLLIGFVIGFLVNGQITKHKIQKMRNEFTEQGFRHQFMRVLRPTPEQMEELKPILREFAGKNRKMSFEYRNDQQELFKELRVEIEPFLTEEQIERLDRHRDRWKDRFRENRRRPPPPGPPM